LNVTKLSSVAVIKETTPLGSKIIGRSPVLKSGTLPNDISENAANDRVQNYLNTLQTNGGTSLIDGTLRYFVSIFT